MTRINIIQPQELQDQHLVAEYKEITRVVPALEKSLNRKKPFNPEKEIPTKYKLGKGHVKFFYNKLLYVRKRYKLLVREMLHRGMNPDPNRTFPDIEKFPAWCKNNWVPTLEEQNVAKARIQQKIEQKPEWYTKTTA